MEVDWTPGSGAQELTPNLVQTTAQQNQQDQQPQVAEGIAANSNPHSWFIIFL